MINVRFTLEKRQKGGTTIMWIIIGVILEVLKILLNKKTVRSFVSYVVSIIVSKQKQTIIFPKMLSLDSLENVK